MSDRAPVSFVLASTARREVIERLAGGPAGGRDLVAVGTASESTIYDAINRLADEGLVARSEDDVWTLTGAGQLVADAIDECDRIETLVTTDESYWHSRDPSGLPERFRRQLTRLVGCSIVRSPEADPFRLSRRVTETIKDASRELAVVAPINDERRLEAMVAAGAKDKRLLVTPDVIEEAQRTEPAFFDTDRDDITVGVADVTVAMVVTGTKLIVSLPRLDGRHDTTSGIVAEPDQSVDWGRRLFEHCWTDARPVETSLDERPGADGRR